MCALCLQEDLSPQLTETVRLLVNGGADPNAIAARYLLLHDFILENSALIASTETIVSVG